MILPKARPFVILQRDLADCFLVDTEGGEVFQINATAAKIFEACASGTELDELVASLAKGLSVPGQEAVIREDVEETVKQLQRLGLCETG